MTQQFPLKWSSLLTQLGIQQNIHPGNLISSSLPVYWRKPAKVRFFSTICAFALACIARTPLAQSIDARPLFHHGKALLIGVSAYQNVGWQKLTHVDPEIDLIRAGLSKHFEQIKVLYDPLSSEIIAAIKTLAQDTETDRIFIYYAGHGFTDYTHNFVGYITARNTSALNSGVANAVASAVEIQEIDNILQSSSAKQIMVVFDSCFSGTTFNTKVFSTPPLRLNEEQIVSNLVQQPVITYITAGKDGQTVPDSTMFAKSFLSAVSGKADYWKNGFVTGADIGIYVNNEIFKQTDEHNDPVVGTSKVDSRREGEFVFAVPEGGPKAKGDAYMIFFGYNTSSLTPEGARIAQLAAQAHRALPQPTKIQVTGFTDPGGLPFERNLEVSQNEAEVVRYALIDLGVEPNAVLHDGRGDKYQRVLVERGVREPRNRRVEIVVPHE